VKTYPPTALQLNIQIYISSISDFMLAKDGSLNYTQDLEKLLKNTKIFEVDIRGTEYQLFGWSRNWYWKICSNTKRHSAYYLELAGEPTHRYNKLGG